MSKNYELLQQAEFGLGGTPATSVGIGAAPKPQESTVNGAVAAAESVAGEESLKLVQRLFLTT
jgi:hypothetical protein